MRPPSLICTVLLAVPLQAQFWSELANPKAEVRLLHPPGLGLHLARVAIAPTGYPASRELGDALAGDLLRRQRIAVVDPGRMDGRDGQGALILVDVHRCGPVHARTRKESKDGKGRLTVTHTATTTLEFAATVQVLEPGTSRVLATRKFDDAPSESATSTSEPPAHPADAELRRSAHGRVAEWLAQLLLPWEEVLRVTFFDDDAYKMDKAAARMKAGDFAGMAEWSASGEAEARNDPGGKAKYRERAFYNLGVARMVQGDFDAARPRLQEARDMNPEAGIFRDTLKECQRALEVQAAQYRWQRSTPAPPPAADGRRDPEQRLLELNRLRQKGLITEEEFSRRKDEILRDI